MRKSRVAGTGTRTTVATNAVAVDDDHHALGAKGAEEGVGPDGKELVVPKWKQAAEDITGVIAGDEGADSGKDKSDKDRDKKDRKHRGKPRRKNVEGAPASAVLGQSGVAEQPSTGLE